MNPKAILSVALMFIGVSILDLGGVYTTVYWRLTHEPATLGHAFPVVLAVVFGGLFVFLGARLWPRWMMGLAAVLVLLGVGGLRTSPADASMAHAAESARAFQLAGGAAAVAGVIVYLVARRRRVG